MGFARQECWNGLPFPSPGDLPDPGIEPRSPALQADASPSEPPGKPMLLLLSRFSRVRLFATPWTAAYQAPPSMGFARQECWSGCHCLLRVSLLPNFKSCLSAVQPLSECPQSRYHRIMTGSRHFCFQRQVHSQLQDNFWRSLLLCHGQKYFA